MINPVSRFSKAVELFQKGAMQLANEACQEILRLDSRHANAWHLQGLIAHQVGNTTQAIEYVKKAIQLQSQVPNFHENLGYLLRTENRLEEAILTFKQEIRLVPEFADAHNRLGSAFTANGDTEQAIASFKRAIEIRPNYADAYNNLGNALQKLGDIDAAIAAYKKTLQIEPKSALTYNNLGKVYLDKDKPEEAVKCFQIAIENNPNLGIAYLNLGKTLSLQGYMDQAREVYVQSQFCGLSAGTKVKLAMLLPPIMGLKDGIIKSRRDFESAIDTLSGKIQIRDPIEEDCPLNFYLAFHGLNNKDIQKKIANFYSAACPTLLYKAAHCAVPRSIARPIKIGFYSKFIEKHSVSRSYAGNIANLSENDGFEISLITTHTQKVGVKNGFVGFKGDVVVVPYNLAAARQQIAALELDILVYLDIGMEPMSYFLAFSRLAPVQCVVGGHPDTTGIANLDYFLSAEMAEPLDADEHYSEKLVKLPFGFFSFQRPADSPSNKSREDLGLPGQGHIYMCPMLLQKIHPDFDDAMKRILIADGDGHIILFGDKKYLSWQILLEKRLDQAIPVSLRSRIIFLPWIYKYEDFMRVAELSAVVLDTFHFGLGTTAIATCAVGTPFVTKPGVFMRGRVGLFITKLLGLHECVADNVEDYVQKAVEIATNPDKRLALKNKIVANSELLYSRELGADSLVNFFNQVVNKN